MKILFVSSGNSKLGISPIVLNQGRSLEKEGVDVNYFRIKGVGLTGYLKNIKILKNLLKENNYNIIHAHYSMSAFVASLAGSKNLVVSLMGSDVKADYFFKIFIYFFNAFFWKKTIVKSKDMKESLGINNIHIIANGVNLMKFKPLSQSNCKSQLKWNVKKKTNFICCKSIKI